MRRPPKHSLRDSYEVRILASTVVSLLLLIAAVKWWPAEGLGDPDDRIYTTRPQEVIEIDEIQQTRQVQQAPPPPAPLPPIIVPNDAILEEIELELDNNLLTLEPADDPTLQEDATDGPPTQLARAETGPKPVRIVEPANPREARRKRIKAEVVVEVLVDERGRVQEATIVERYLLGDEDDPKTAVGELGYGLEEAAVSAAERWLFRPARQNGRPVTSYTTVTLLFGV